MSAPAPLYDSHSHLSGLEGARRDRDPDAAIARARALGVDRVLLPAVAPAGWDAIAALRDRHSALRIAVGIHPHALDALEDAELDAALAALADRARSLRAVAIGECGLDGRVRSSIARQARALEAQLEIARTLDLPVVLHVVRAEARASELVARQPGVRGVVHGWTGAPETARRWIARGMHLGLGARMLDPRARRTRECARSLPLDRLLIETDDADPALLPGIAATLASLRGIAEAEVRRATHANASSLFG